MKKLILALAVLSSSALAQPQKINIQVECDKHDKVMDALQKDYKENIVWVGKTKELTYGVLANNKTKTWTIVVTDNNVMCVMASGEGSFLANPI